MRAVLLVAAPLAGLLFATACSEEAPTPAAGAASAEAEAEAVELPTVTVDELAARLEARSARAVDANGDATRARQGVIPGAALLSHYKKYALDELPPDRAGALVFYCANEECSASHRAAERAIAAGYRDVAVLSAGIAGWRKAGKPTATP